MARLFRVEVDPRAASIRRRIASSYSTSSFASGAVSGDALVHVLMLVELVSACERGRVERHFIPTKVQIAVRPHHRGVADEEAERRTKHTVTKSIWDFMLTMCKEGKTNEAKAALIEKRTSRKEEVSPSGAVSSRSRRAGPGTRRE